mgnify:CR=1 FL=1
MSADTSFDEDRYDSTRLAQWTAGQARGDGITRRTALQLSAGLGLAAVPTLGGKAAAREPAPAGTVAAASAGPGPIVKALRRNLGRRRPGVGAVRPVAAQPTP